MRIAYLDCPSGISGDMTLGALVDAGVPLDHLNEAIGSLGVPGVKLVAQRSKNTASARPRSPSSTSRNTSTGICTISRP